MSRFFALTKINVTNMLKMMFSFGGKKKRGKAMSSAGFVALVVALVGLMMYSISTLYTPYVEMLTPYGMANYMFLFAGLTTFIFVLFFIVAESGGHLFKCKDYELLSSMPLRAWEIVGSKFVGILVTAYIYGAIAYIPAIIVYFCFCPFHIMTLLSMVIGYVFFPLIPTMLGILIGLFVTYISSKFKKANIIFMILMFAVIILYTTFSSQVLNMVQKIIEGGSDSLYRLVYFLPNIVWLVDGVANCNWVNTLYFVLINIVGLLITLAIVSLLFFRVNNALQNVKVSITKAPLTYKSFSPRKRLLKNELKRYFSSSMLVVNTLIAPILLCAIPVTLYFSLKDLLPSLMLIPELHYVIPTMFTMIGGVLMSMCAVSCTSISLEGKSFYTLKMIPVSTKDILWSKTTFNILLGLPFIFIYDVLTLSLFGSTIFSLGTLNIVATLIGISIVPLLGLTAVSVFGTYINLKFPKTVFDNAVQVIKQSASFTITYLGLMLVNALVGVLYFALLSKYLGAIYLIAGLALVYVTIIVVSSVLLKKQGQRLFNNIQG